MPAQSLEPDPYQATVFCADVALTDEARSSLTEGEMVPDYLEKLIANRNYVDATQVLAKLMPAREGVWWAAHCVTTFLGSAPDPREVQALRAAEQWVTDMTEASRAKCYEAAQAVRLGSPANCVAMAAFVCGPSLAPQGEEVVPPAPDLPAKLVAGTVMAASQAATPELSAAQLATFLEQGKLLFNQVVGGAA
jgi:hypothetical protein